MSDPIEQILGTHIVIEGIKFLYGQATEALKRLRDKEKDPASPEEVPTQNSVPAIFSNQPQELMINLSTVKQLADDINKSRSYLNPYAEGIQSIETDNATVISHVSTLRSLLEQVYDEDLTFSGEDRKQDGTSNIFQQLLIQKHSGEAVGVEVSGGNTNSSVKQQTRITEVTPTGKITGVKLSG